MGWMVRHCTWVVGQFPSEGKPRERLIILSEGLERNHSEVDARSFVDKLDGTDEFLLLTTLCETSGR